MYGSGQSSYPDDVYFYQIFGQVESRSGQSSYPDDVY